MLARERETREVDRFVRVRVCVSLHPHLRTSVRARSGFRSGCNAKMLDVAYFFDLKISLEVGRRRCTSLTSELYRAEINR